MDNRYETKRTKGVNAKQVKPFLGNLERTMPWPQKKPDVNKTKTE